MLTLSLSDLRRDPHSALVDLGRGGRSTECGRCFLFLGKPLTAGESVVAVDLPLPAMLPYCPSTPRQAVECQSAALQQRQAAAWCVVRRETLHHPRKLEKSDGG